MLQQPEPRDYAVATGEQHSVREFVVEAAQHGGMYIEWRGAGAQEVGVDRHTGWVVVRVDPRYFRPAEVDALLGDASRIRRELGWVPEVSFSGLITEMMIADLTLARRDALVAQQGQQTTRNRE